MRLYKCVKSGDEMFSDTYKMRLIDGVVYEVYGSVVTRRQDDIQLEGSNPSAEEAAEGTDLCVESGVDIVMNHLLVETYIFNDKKAYLAYLKPFMKVVLQQIEEKDPENATQLKENLNKYVKDLLTRFKELQFFTGENMDFDGTIGVCEYRDVDGKQVPVFSFFKHGLTEEKI